MQRIVAQDVNAAYRGDVYGERQLFTDEAFERFVRANDVDLERSLRAAGDGALAGLFMLAQRGDRGWVAGFAVVPERRGSGFAGELFAAGLRAATAAGVRRLELEVLQRNAPARKLYERFGFKTIDELLVWSRDGVADSRKGVELLTRTLGEVEAVVRTPEVCWQRHARAVAATPSALIECGSAYAFVGARGDRGGVLDAGANEEADAQHLVAELERVAVPLTLLNEPAASPLSAALHDAPWRVAERQYRMVLEL